ncbi:MAG: hypothetical protein FJ356_01590, partial [Thaumarchaeota archaeon]|nr:hypothetical protein [Nitrososphaerota archaeon]
SGFGAPATATQIAGQVPDPPTGVTVSGAESGTNWQHTVTWTAPSFSGTTAVSGYKIERATDSGFTTGVTTLSANTESTAVTYTDSPVPLSPISQSYFYRVSAINSIGTGVPSTVSSAAVSPPLPDAPTNLQSSLSGTNVNLSWVAPANSMTVTSYTIQRATNSGFTEPVTTYTSQTNSFTDTNAIAGTTYHYRVSATNPVGTGSYSSGISQLVGNPPQEPTSLGLSLAYPNVNLSWTAPANTGGIPLTGYKIERAPVTVNYLTGSGQTIGEFTTLVADTGNTNVSYTDTTGVAGTTYAYRVYALNAAGISASASNEPTILVVIDPGLPTGFVLQGQQSGSNWNVVMSWTAPESFGSGTNGGYQVQRSPDGNTWTTLQGSELTTGKTSNSETYTDESLSLGGVTYYYRLTSIGTNTGGLSMSGQSGTTFNPSYTAQQTITSPVVPDPPTTLTATPVVGSQINLSWSSPQNNGGMTINSYTLQRSTDQTNWTQIFNGAALTYSDTGLTNGQTYYYRVFATNAVGDSSVSSTANAKAGDTPSVPTNISGTGQSDTSIFVTWDASNGNGYDVTYVLQRTLTPNTAESWETIASPTSTSYVDTGLQPSTKYHYRVASVNALAQSAYSSSVQIATYGIPDPVNTLGVSGGLTTTGVNLIWSQPEMNGFSFTSYRLQQSTDQNTWINLSTSINTESYSVTGLNTNSVYFFRVFASNTFGESVVGNILSVTTIPSPTSLLSASGFSATQINLSWVPASGAATTGYKIERSLDQNTWTVIVANTGSTGNSYQNQGLETLTTYYYRVSTINNAGVSVASNIANAKTFGYPEAPGTLSTQPLVGKQIKLDWSSPSVLNGGTVSGYKIQRSTDSSTWSTLVSDTTNTLVTYTDTSLTSEQIYYYRVAAITQYGEGDYSNISSSTAADIPEQITGLTLTPISNYRSSISWSVPYSHGLAISSYTVQRSVDGTTWATVASPTTASYIDVTGVTTPSTFYYRVSATNQLGTGSYSSSSSVLVGDVPSQVVGLVITPSANGVLGLTWTASSNNGYELQYEIQRSINGINWSPLTTQTQTSYSDTGLTLGTIYYYKIMAFNQIGNGQFSTVSSKMAGDTPAAPSLTLTTLSDTQVKLQYEVSPYILTQYPITGYKIEISTDSQTWTVLNQNFASNTFTATNLIPRTEYYFKVSAINSIGLGDGVEDSIETFGPPDQITGLSASSTGTTNTLVWTAPVNNGGANVSYRIYVQLNNLQWSLLSTTQATTFTATQNIQYNTLYTYKVSPFNQYGLGTESTVNILSNPAIPGNFKAVTASGTAITLTWSHISNFDSNTNYYKIYYSTDDGDTYSLLANQLTSTSYQATGYSNGQTVYFKISATNNNSEGAQSTAVYATTYNVPGIPGSFTLTNPSSTSVKVQWTKPTTGGDPTALVYEIYRSNNQNFNNPTITTKTSLSFTDTGLQASLTYYYKVRAINTAGNGQFTNALSYTTGEAPNTPSSLTATITGTNANAIKLQWGAPTPVTNSVTGYKIERNINGGGWSVLVSNTGSTVTTMTDQNLDLGSTYQYRVSAINIFGSGQPSNIASASLSSTSVTITGNALTGNTVIVEGSVTSINSQGLSIINIKLYKNNAKIEDKSVNISLSSGTASLPDLLAYPTTQSDFYVLIKISNGATVKSNTISLTPDAPFEGDIDMDELRNSSFTESTVTLQIQPSNSDVIIKWQPQNTNEPAIYKAYKGVSGTLISKAPVAAEKDYYGSVFVNPTISFNVGTNSSLIIQCDENIDNCKENQVPVGTFSAKTFKSFRSPTAQPQLGLEPMGNLFGVNMVFLFVIAMAGIFTGRSATMGVIFIAATLGVMGYLGYIDFFQPDATWALIIICAIIGIFVGKRMSGL